MTDIANHGKVILIAHIVKGLPCFDTVGWAQGLKNAEISKHVYV